MNHTIKVLEQEKVMLVKILKPYRYNIEKGFDVSIGKMNLYEERLNEVNTVLALINA